VVDRSRRVLDGGEFLRTTWRAVQAIVERVVTERAGKTDLLSGLRRIGIDETSYRKGQRHLTCVVDHDTGRLVWAAEGRNSETILKFFDALGKDRTKKLTHVSADGAEWIHTPVTARAPQAVLCLDPFHVVQWATNAVDKVRRGLWNTLRGKGNTHRPATSKAPAGPYSKTPATSPASNAPRSRPSPRPTTASTAPTCSKNNSARCSPHEANPCTVPLIETGTLTCRF
jgi:transposase